MNILKQTQTIECSCDYGFVWPAHIDIEIDQEKNTYRVLGIRVPATSRKTEEEVSAAFTEKFRKYMPHLTRVA
jgi:hypothetical protein